MERTTSSGDRLKKYVDKIELIPEGERNRRLHNIGLLLRKNFGLTADSLLSVLSAINQTKCRPPVNKSEIKTITGSVDRASIPIGDGSGVESPPKQRGTSPPASNFYVSATADSVPVADLLKRKVSLYQNSYAQTPKTDLTVGKCLEGFRTGGNSKEQIDAIRNETDKAKRDKLKQGLHGVIFGSEPQTKRNADACKANGIVVVDFDNIPAGDLESAKETIAKVDYIFAVGLSVGGQGVFALAAYEGTPGLKTLLAAMQEDFCYTIDKSGTDISRLRYVTADENLIVKEKVYPAILRKEQTDDFDDAETLRYVPFPVECLPSTLSRWIRDTQRCINLKSSDMPAVSVLAVLSSVIGSSCRIAIKRGYTEPAALFTAIVADSGSAKSPSIEAATKHLNTLQGEKIKQWKQEKHQWEQDLKFWSNTANKKERGDEPAQPQPAVRYIISDATLESVTKTLENNPFGVLLNRDELNGFFSGMDAYRKSATDLQSWIEIYEGGSVTIDRKTTGVTHIDKPSVSIIGGVQKAILKQTIQERPDFIHSGFGSRFLFVMPKKEPIIWNDNEPDQKIVADYESLIDCILACRESVLENEQDFRETQTGDFSQEPLSTFATVKPIIFTLSAGAKKELFAFQEKQARQAVYESIPDAAAMNKGGRIAARLCLTLHCVRSIEMTGNLRGLLEVSKETAGQAVKLADWFIHEATRVYAMLAEGHAAGELPPDQMEVMKVLQRIGKPATIREMKRASRVLSKMDNLEETLRQLISMKKVEDYFRQNGAIEYKISPVDGVDADKSPVKPGEKRASVSVNAVNTVKNAFSPPDVIDGFGEYRNPPDPPPPIEPARPGREVFTI